MESPRTTLRSLGLEGVETIGAVGDVRPYFSVHRVGTSEGEYYLKRGQGERGERALAREIAVCRRLTDEPGVPVPTVAATGVDPPAMLTVACDGTQGSALAEPAAGRPDLLRDLGDRLAAIHETQSFETPGQIEPAGGSGLGVDAADSFAGLLLEREDDPQTLGDGRFADLANEIRDLLGRRRSDVEPEGDYQLLHGDFAVGNTTVRDGRVTCVLDWEHALAGDPAYDCIGLLYSLFGPAVRAYPDAATTALYEGYERRRDRGDDWERRYRWYWLCNILGMLAAFEEWDWSALQKSREEVAADIRDGVADELERLD